MIKKYILIASIFFLLVAGCKNVKDALSGKKSENSDEFLVIKKNPLTLPPDFDELPEPKNKGEDQSDEEVNSIQKLLTGIDENNCVKKSNCKKKIPIKSGSTEDFVLKKINEN